ncbi:MULTISPECIES: zinc-binding metallopeptidase [unclassified Sphingobacterium]|uniref:zinc-binding metallopeptidase n=1 Tax=unclassified Sphingobacterium TaxID=2609468 RepID=UPI0025E1C9CF|nr:MULTISPECIES: putative zinc-binding metallopeptidase [unclassified Sphingobacterium]
MKNNTLLISILLSFSVMFSGCNKEDKLDSKSVFVDSEIPKNALDNYLYNNYTKPYNVQILYKYNDNESNMTYRLVPAPYDASIRLSKLMLFLVMDPYSEVTGSTQFLRSNFPKIITYTGSVPVQTNGVIILGTAESGTKVSLYNLLELNETTGKNSQFLTNGFFKTVHHEFQHILNQNKPYPSNFREISGSNYIEDEWNTKYPNNTVGIGSAIAAGFISPYASKADTEDFAELYSFYVTRSQADFDAMLNVENSTAAGRTLILSKLAIVKSYMKSEWGIDMDILRANIIARYPKLSTFDQTTLN